MNFCDKSDWFDVKQQQINKQDSFELVEKFVKHNFDFFDRSDEQQYQRLIARKSALKKTQLSDVLITDNLFW